jgi:hypothetical protein
MSTALSCRSHSGLRAEPLEWRLAEGVVIIASPDNTGAVDTIAILVIVCFLVGIFRSWELVGGPSFGLTREVTALVRGQQNEPADEDKTA